ncbi:MAG: hypothetical protein AABZ74_10165, partial [Cyanobacteriota bacterium]
SLSEQTALSIKQNTKISLDYDIKSKIDNNYKTQGRYILRVNKAFNEAFNSYSQIKFVNSKEYPKYKITINIENFNLKQNIEHEFGQSSSLETVKGEIFFSIKVTNGDKTIGEKDFNLRTTQNFQTEFNSPESNQFTGKLYKKALEDLLNKSIIVIDKYLENLTL